MTRLCLFDNKLLSLPADLSKERGNFTRVTDFDSENLTVIYYRIFIQKESFYSYRSG